MPDDGAGNAERCGAKEQIRLAADSRVIDVLEGLLGRVEKVRPLQDADPMNGTGGLSFVARAGGREVHLKLAHPDSFRLLDIEAEYRLLQRLADAGLCPRPLGFDADRQVIVSEFMTGHLATTAAELRDAAAIADLSLSLAMLHAVDQSIPVHPQRAIADRYLGAIAGEPDAHAHGAERQRAADYRELADEFDALAEPRVLCHGDLTAGNIMRARQRDKARAPGVPFGGAYRFVDFEYAQSAPPVLDLASVAVMNGFGEFECNLLLEQYGQAAARAISAELFAKVRRLIALTAHFWSLAGGDNRAGR